MACLGYAWFTTQTDAGLSLIQSAVCGYGILISSVTQISSTVSNLWYAVAMLLVFRLATEFLTTDKFSSKQSYNKHESGTSSDDSMAGLPIVLFLMVTYVLKTRSRAALLSAQQTASFNN